MHNPTAFFDKVIPCGLTISKKNDFPNMQVLRDEAAKSFPRIPVQRETPWYAEHFEALGYPEVTDQFTAWVNNTMLTSANSSFRTPECTASLMVAEIVQHYSLTEFAIEWSKTVWAIVVGGAEHEAVAGRFPVYPNTFIAGYKFEPEEIPA